MKVNCFFILVLFLMKIDSSFSQTLFAKKIMGMNQSVCMIVSPDSNFTIVSSGAEFIRINKFGTTLVQPTYSISSNPVLRVMGIINTIDSCHIISGYTTNFTQDNRPFIAKVHLNGEMQWMKYTNGILNNSGFKTIQLTDGSLISSTYLRDSVTLKYSVYFQKTDSSGNLLWAKTLHSQESCAILDFCPTSDGGFVGIGFKGQHAIIEKLDSSGAMTWYKAFSDSSLFGVRISILSDGNYFIIGQSGAYPNSKFYLAKIDTSGNFIWCRLYDRTISNNSYSIVERSNGDLVVAGCVDNCTYGFLMITDSAGTPKVAKKYLSYPPDSLTYFYSVFESNDLSLVLFGQGNFQSLYTANIIIKVDSLGNGFCNTYPDSIQFSSLICSTIPDTISISPFITTTATISCARYNSAAMASNICSISETPTLIDRTLSIYPNPVKDYLTISLTDNFSIHSLEVYNSLGQKVLFKEINVSQDHELTIPISLPQGIYYGRLISGQEVLSFNFVVAE